ncbi:hypothetical protein [Paraburkholderia caribensis]|uniref:hypothetical protein n=1 Tax=Paraburkholderia caribensis TaxID=75105 RepID=UPI001591F1F4|nr:hypothetical protein [Paraburkholderia caribensis]
MTDRKAILRRFSLAYLSIVAMMAFVLMVSLKRGSDWKVLLVGMPLFVIFFVGVTYQFVKEWRQIRPRSKAGKNNEVS